MEERCEGTINISLPVNMDCKCYRDAFVDAEYENEVLSFKNADGDVVDSVEIIRGGSGVEYMIEYGTLSAYTPSTVPLSGNAEDGYRVSDIGPSANGNYYYHINFPTKYNAETDTLELQGKISGKEFGAVQGYPLSQTSIKNYGISLFSCISITSTDYDMLLGVGRGGLFLDNAWNSATTIDTRFRVVKKSLIIE